MASVTHGRATLDDLYRTEGKAELIGGSVVELMAAGDLPSQVAFEIAVRLREYARRVGQGVAYPDGVGYAVAELPSGRESFSPDASYYMGSRPVNRMRFIEGPPTFAVEVRSENDYGEAAEEAMAAKRSDYFAAGTLVVWDVDPLAPCIHAYRAADPAKGVTYGPLEIAEAEPAVPGWRLPVHEVFPAETSPTG
jgi:Uma2 family endonuclease